MGIEEGAQTWQIRNEDKVQQIDVQRTPSDILQRHADGGKFGEILLVVAEIRKGNVQ